jgi:hypothetical protein
MAEPEAVTHLPRPLPDVVEIPAGVDLGLTADEMDQLRAAADLSLNVLLGDDEDVDNVPNKQRALVWLALRRQGYDPAWSDCGKVALRRPEAAAVDPTGAGS